MSQYKKSTVPASDVFMCFKLLVPHMPKKVLESEGVQQFQRLVDSQASDVCSILKQSMGLLKGVAKTLNMLQVVCNDALSRTATAADVTHTVKNTWPHVTKLARSIGLIVRTFQAFIPNRLFEDHPNLSSRYRLLVKCSDFLEDTIDPMLHDLTARLRPKCAYYFDAIIESTFTSEDDDLSPQLPGATLSPHDRHELIRAVAEEALLDIMLQGERLSILHEDRLGSTCIIDSCINNSVMCVRNLITLTNALFRGRFDADLLLEQYMTLYPDYFYFRGVHASDVDKMMARAKYRDDPEPDTFLMYYQGETVKLSQEFVSAREKKQAMVRHLWVKLSDQITRLYPYETYRGWDAVLRFGSCFTVATLTSALETCGLVKLAEEVRCAARSVRRSLTENMAGHREGAIEATVQQFLHFKDFYTDRSELIREGIDDPITTCNVKETTLYHELESTLEEVGYRVPVVFAYMRCLPGCQRLPSMASLPPKNMFQRMLRDVQLVAASEEYDASDGDDGHSSSGSDSVATEEGRFDKGAHIRSLVVELYGECPVCMEELSEEEGRVCFLTCNTKSLAGPFHVVCATCVKSGALANGCPQCRMHPVTAIWHSSFFADLLDD